MITDLAFKPVTGEFDLLAIHAYLDASPQAARDPQNPDRFLVGPDPDARVVKVGADKVRHRQCRPRRSGSLGRRLSVELMSTLHSASHLRWIALATVGLFACKGGPAHDPTHEPPAPAYQAASRPDVDAKLPDAAITAAPADRLPVCGTPFEREPLAALCALGGPATKAVFDCAEPKPIMFCRGATWWTCFRNVPGGEVVPEVQFSAAHASSAPPPKSGTFVDTSTMKRDGTVLGIKISWKEASDARGAERVRRLLDQLVQSGCTVTDEYQGRYSLDCGTWTAKVLYDQILDEIFLEAQQRGSFKC